VIFAMTEEFEFNEDTKCVYQILKDNGELSSKAILEMAVTEKYKEICTGCVSGDSFLRAVKQLEKADIIDSSLKKGGYYWKLK
jgi:hypothetical protein